LIHPHPPVGTFSRQREGSYTQAKVFFITILEIVPLIMKRMLLVLGAILLPLAGEGADRRMRVDQYTIFISSRLSYLPASQFSQQ
jgi:hypothetical protein